jgi:hypothetical protein
MDVIYSVDAVPSRLHQQLTFSLDALAQTRRRSPMPHYHNLIDPNVNAVDGLWVPAEFEASEVPRVDIETVISIELACVAATGQRLPFGVGPHIAILAADGCTRAECALRSPIPDLDPHEHVNLQVYTQKLMKVALPPGAASAWPAAGGGEGITHRACRRRGLQRRLA